MAFTNFKSIADVQLAYSIRHIWANFIPDIAIEPPASLVDELNFKYEAIDI